MSKSQTINGLCENFSDISSFPLDDSVKPEWVQLMTEIVRGHQIIPNKDNVLTLLYAGHYFNSKSLVDICDQYFLANPIKKELIARVKIDEKQTIDSSSNFHAKWRFCDRFGLINSQNALALEVLKKLKTGKEADHALLKKVSLLNLSHIKDGLSEAYYLEFKSSLKNDSFLKDMWEIGHEVEIIRHAIVEFCRDPKNEITIRGTWATMPKNLAILLPQLFAEKATE